MHNESTELPNTSQHPKADLSAWSPDDQWFIRSFFDALFNNLNDHPLTKKFNSVEDFLIWFSNN
jgi:hypothetical protein